MSSENKVIGYTTKKKALKQISIEKVIVTIFIQFKSDIWK